MIQLRPCAKWVSTVAFFGCCLLLHSVGSAQGPQDVRSARSANVQPNPFPATVSTVPNIHSAPAPVNIPDFQLTGVAYIGSKKWAFFIRQDPSVAPVYVRLQEKQSNQGVDLLQVDLIKRRARIRFAGQELVLSLAGTSTQVSPDTDIEAAQFVAQHKQFVTDHVQAHELRQQQERERESRERLVYELQQLDNSKTPDSAAP